MTYPVIVWCAIAGVLLSAFVFRSAVRLLAAYHRHRRRRRILEFGKETDIFFIPGDYDNDDDFAG